MDPLKLPLTSIPFVNKRIKFPVTPHIPGGLATPEQLRRIATVAEKYGGTLKIFGGGITIMGLRLSDGEKAITELEAKPESFMAKSIRGVTICPGKPDCPMAQQDSTALGLTLDEKFFGRELPGKIRIGVSGCPNCCAEVTVKDIGLYATAFGYTLIVGGNSGRHARIGREVAKNLPADQISSVVASILDFFCRHGQTKERLGQVIDRVGWDLFNQQVIPEAYRI